MAKSSAVPAAGRPRHAVRVTKAAVACLKRELAQYMDGDGFLSWSAKEKKYVILGTNSPKKGLVRCPECGLGELMVVRSRATRKRFMGCSNFYGGCTASSPLLQRARLRATKSPCDACGWPLVIFRYTRKQRWTKQCSNITCKSREA